MTGSFSHNAKVFKALCDETRWTVLSLLQSGEKCACVLLETLNLAQPTLSYHMKILVESGIVTARKDGKWTYYAICAEGCETAARIMRKLAEAAEATVELNEEECCG